MKVPTWRYQLQDGSSQDIFSSHRAKDTALSLPYTRLVSERDFKREASRVKFDTEPPPLRHSFDVNSKVCSSVRAFELQVATEISNPFLAKRVLREFVKYNKNPHPDFTLFPLSRNLMIWKGIVEGPERTPYEGGIFDFYLSFGEGYPQKAPEMRFLTPIFHTNITQSGKICHPIFDTSYTSETSIRDILNYVYSLLMTQDFDDYNVSNLRISFSINKDDFIARAQDCTLQHAVRYKPKEEVIREMMIEGECPDEYKCALSKQIMRNPVYSPQSERVFEKSVIEAHVRATGKDPLTNLPLRLDDLVPYPELKKKINEQYPS